MDKKPWEEYQTQSSTSEGPWQEFQTPNAEAVNERHPDVGAVTRAVYKNLANEGDDAGLAYLQKQNPELQFRKNKNGEVEIAGGSAGDKWMRLDPTNKWYAPEFADITDGIFGLGQSAAETTASALGGVVVGAGGTAVAPGVGTAVGALGGASLAGAAAGTGMDYLRQKLGQLAGIDQEVDTDSLVSNFKWGAASPLFFGTGAAGKNVAKLGGKYITQQGGREVLSNTGQALLKGQSGLLNRGFQGTKGYLAPRSGQLMSGLDKNTLTRMSKNLDVIRETEKSPSLGAEIYGELREKIEGSLSKKLNDVGQRLGEAGKNSGIKVNIEDVEAPMRELLEKYEQRALKSIDKHGDAAASKAAMKNYEYLKNKLEPYMEGSGVLEGKNVKEYLDNINQVTGIAKSLKTDAKPTLDKDLIRVARQATSILDTQASQGPAGQVYKSFKNEYSKLKSVENDVVNKWFKDDMATERTLNSLLSRKKKAQKLNITKGLEELDIDITDDVKNSISNTLFVNPNLDVLSSMGTTSTSRSVPLGGIGGILGYKLGGDLIGGHGGGLAGAGLLGLAGSKIGSPAAMRKFAEMNAGTGAAKEALYNLGPGMLPAAPNAAINTWQQMYSE